MLNLCGLRRDPFFAKMNYLKVILFTLNFISASTANSQYRFSSYKPVNADCHDYVIPVKVTSENYQWTGPRWNDNYEFIDFLTVASYRPSVGVSPPFGNRTEETCSYQIGGTFCAPKKRGPKSKTILLATHGLGFDKRYFAIWYLLLPRASLIIDLVIGTPPKSLKSTISFSTPPSAAIPFSFMTDLALARLPSRFSSSFLQLICPLFVSSLSSFFFSPLPYLFSYFFLFSHLLLCLGPVSFLVFSLQSFNSCPLIFLFILSSPFSVSFIS